MLLGAVVLTGLSAGLFCAWSVSVIPGTKKVVDITYLETMQAINRAILNPAFFFIFFGSFLFLGVSGIYQFSSNNLAFALILAAAICYLAGTIGITGMGNVPLNNQLDIFEIDKGGPLEISAFRQYYESSWNRLHAIRTTFATISFLLTVLALFAQARKV